MTDIIASLNEPQRRAVTHSPQEPLLVLAGAGSGKTRVLVHRVAWLVTERYAMPAEILAVTFTNKAAREMNERIEDLLNQSSSGLWIGTFHRLCHRLLRMHCQQANLDINFQILDADDQLKLVKRLLKTAGIPESDLESKKVAQFIQRQKEYGHRYADVANDHTLDRQMLSIYQAYEDTCQKSSLVDFSELLMRCCEMFSQNPALLAHYQQHFKHVLIDEFQDTNSMQYRWLQLLTNHGKTPITAVGDDDQSIYSWRGAKIEHMLSFSEEVSNVTRIDLTQNYRSTSVILQAANAVIQCNENRLGKDLWTDLAEGDKIDLYHAYDEMDEALYIAQRIRSYHQDKDCPYTEMAVLYRSNAQSRALEEALIKTGTPYRVYGGLRFFDRAEIKDIFGYARLLVNRHDDAAFERVINTPTRGIGATTLQKLRSSAQSQRCSLWSALEHSLDHNLFSKRTHGACDQFRALLTDIDDAIATLSLPEQIEVLIERSELIQHYSKQEQTVQNRLENLRELITSATLFNRSQVAEDCSMLAEFIAQATLDNVQNDHQSGDAVNLMTVHAAKGLEFNLVCMTGMEEQLFPHAMSYGDSTRTEEERRLCYVGITRAKQHLIISHADVRHLYGQQNHQSVSRFIGEIPASCLQRIRPQWSSSSSQKPSYTSRRSSRPTPQTRPTPQPMVSARSVPTHSAYQLGQRVRHNTFGEGVILYIEEDGDHYRLQIKFEHYGVKWLLTEYAQLTTI